MENAKNINPRHIRTLNLQVKYANKIKNSEELRRIINELYQEYEFSSAERKDNLNEIMSDAHFSLLEIANEGIYKPMMRKYFESHLTDKSIEKNAELLLYKAKYHIGITRYIDKANTYFHSSLEAPDIIDVLPLMLSILDCVNTDYLSNVNELLEQNKHELEDKIYFEAISDINVLQKNYDEALKGIERAYDSGLSLSDYLTNYSYICLMARQYDLIVEMHKRYKNYVDIEGFEAWKINYSYALKQKGATFSKVSLRNLSAQSKNENIKLAAFAVLDNVEAAKRILRSQIKKDYTNYFKYSRWPILTKLSEFLKEENSTLSNIEVMT